MADITFIGTQPQWWDHLAPLTNTVNAHGAFARCWNFPPHVEPTRSALRDAMSKGPVVAASWVDAMTAYRAGARNIVLMEHGAGQSYSSRHRSYPGGQERNKLALVLAPNEQAAERHRKFYRNDPKVVVVGCPKLDDSASLKPKPCGYPPVVAVSWHWDLVPTGTIVAGPAPTGMAVRRYRGDLIHIETVGANRLSVSPEHPVLTLRGWVRASDLHTGDHLVRPRSDKWHPGVAPENHLPPSRVEDLAGAFMEPLKVSAVSMPPSAPHLDSDGLDEQVDVIGTDGFLCDGVESAALSQGLSDLGFQGTRLTQVEFTSPRPPLQLWSACAGEMPGLVHGEATEGDLAPFERSIHSRLPHAESLGKGQARFPFEVETDEISFISRREYVGHGYDLTTVPQWYVADGFIVHNCKVSPEAGTAWSHNRTPLTGPAILDELVRMRDLGMIQLLGHAHPRIAEEIHPVYREREVPIVSFEEVMLCADLYMIDNSSTLFEFAALDRPVIVVDSPRYRPGVRHGLRFWTHANIGVRISEPSDVARAVMVALEDPQEVADQRRKAVAEVYPHLGTSRFAALNAIAAKFRP